MTRQEPVNEAFGYHTDYAYAEQGRRDAFEADWNAGGQVLVTVERVDGTGDTTWAGEYGARTNIGPKKIRAVLGEYSVFLRAHGVEEIPAEIISEDIAGVVFYDVDVDKDDVFFVEEGQSPYADKRFRVEKVRYFPRSKRAVCAARLVTG